MAQKPGIPKGTRDFGPVEMERRNYIFNTITSVYKIYGYKQIETPAMENLSTLMGKYGEEGDKLLFKILNSGDYLSKVSAENLNQSNSNKLTTQISEKGLRYDLTVPFARFVVQHQNELTFPFKRFQIQPVWRADRPQRGRYREFYQCDSDVIGSDSLLNEVELIQIIDEVFQKLDIKIVIKINNRKILAGIAEAMGISDRIIELTVALDKMDKIGLEKVIEEILSTGIPESALPILNEITKLTTLDNESKINKLEEILQGSEEGKKGISEMKEVFELTNSLQIKNSIVIDLTLARGLNYYTGSIFEVSALGVQMGSICGGGRYDDLTGIFGLNGMSGVGVSFGADRIYDVLLELDAFPKSSEKGTKLMIINFGKNERIEAIKIAQILRQNNIETEVFPDSDKLKKQMNYADKNKIKYVLMAGDSEIKENLYQLKNMENGEQQKLDLQQLIEVLR